MNDEQRGPDEPRSSFIAHRSSLAEGISLFNAHQFWHAHEAWERIWLQSEGDPRRFLQGLIQLAAAYHHVQRGTFRGGVRLFDAALSKLATFPVHFLEIDRDEVVAIAKNHRDRIARGEHIDEKDFPKFRYN